MTKTLLVLRHAKSSWKFVKLADHDRPLNGRGKRDAPRIGRLLAERELVPDLILSSSARRAHDTVELVAEHSGYVRDPVWGSSLYLGGHQAYLDSILTTADEVDRLMVVGHNPDVEMLVEALTGEFETMPTGALAQIELPIDHWNQLQADGGNRLVTIWRPRNLAAEDAL
ncbi:MAG: histidine phosphatase family protein [Caldilineaceae bacterium]|nr:histidine phosphatase family protein [Caldilineaceae bacterium]MCB9137414.1 histidine phosphatase family protein [Caldilineaceae bacterium]